jgi:Uma2 family endonuclease
MATPTSFSGSASGVVVRHRVAGFSERWILPEGHVPEAPWHDEAAELFRQIIRAFIARTGRNAAVYRSVAIRVQSERPTLGFDPDVCIVEPPPPGSPDIDSIRLWEPGHSVPRFALEVVSKNHPYKDYIESPDKCAAAGVGELVVFDPKRSGPKVLGRSPLLSQWLRAPDGSFERVFAADGPAYSPHLTAWLTPVQDGQRLRIADDSDGQRLWPTPEEAVREQSLRRIAELEAALAKR